MPMRFILFFLLVGVLKATGPVIFWTDLNSGPATGGENNNGVYLTIGGNSFGVSRGTSTVEINGTAVAQVLYWSNTKLGVQVAAGTTTGPVTVTVGGQTATGPTFTVRSGSGPGYRILYVGPAPDNTTLCNSGCTQTCAQAIAGGPGSQPANSYATPWGLTSIPITSNSAGSGYLRTPNTLSACISPGDTLVFLDGTNYQYFDGRGLNGALLQQSRGLQVPKLRTRLALGRQSASVAILPARSTPSWPDLRTSLSPASLLLE